MIQINLLPYRKERRNQEVSKILIAWGAVALFGVIISFSIDFYMSSIADDLQNTKSQNEARITDLDKQLGELKKLEELKAALQKRLDVIAQLSKNRDLPERVLTELSLAIPNKIWFKSLDVKQDRISLQGISESNSDIADFMTKLAKSPLFHTIELGRSLDETVQGISLKSFEMNVGLKPPS